VTTKVTLLQQPEPAIKQPATCQSQTSRCLADATRRPLLLLLLLVVPLAVCSPASSQQRRSRLVWLPLPHQLHPAIAETRQHLGAATNQHPLPLLETAVVVGPLTQ
jgi:hypothetical protein